MAQYPELGPIRPPSEAYSLLVRVTRNCPWNRCRFCHTYKADKFQTRPVAEVKADIAFFKAMEQQIRELAGRNDFEGSLQAAAHAVLQNPPHEAAAVVALWLLGGGKSIFIQDADSLVLKTEEMADILQCLRETFPKVSRVTSYGRCRTLDRKTLDELVALREAGLTRLHVGLETGYDPLLAYIDKGATAQEEIASGIKVREAGLELSEYVIMGLGGRAMWREHARETARVLSEIKPDFIRVRTLSLNRGMPLYQDYASGAFEPLTETEIIAEERLLLENLSGPSYFLSDHMVNLLPEVEGHLPEDKERLLAVLDYYLGLTPSEQYDYQVGRRFGVYNQLADRNEPAQREAVAQLIARHRSGGREIGEEDMRRILGQLI
jgi:hypothetical protein